MKKILLLIPIMMLSASMLHAQMRIDMQVITGARPARPEEVRAMKAEEDAHPNIARAMHDLENGMKSLQAAPDDFGGHKAQAAADMKAAWISLRKALYFRLYQDMHH